MKDNKELKEEDFEQYMEKLEMLLSNMETDKPYTLSQFLKEFEQGAQIIEKCEKILQKATLRVKKVNDKLTHINDENNGENII